MFCRKCGSELQDNAKFCGACGTMVEEQPVQEAPAPVSVKQDAAVPAQPKTKKISRKTGIIIAGVAAVLVVVLVAASLFGGAGGTVAKAFAKSLKAYTDVADQMNLPDMAKIAGEGKHNQEMRMWLEDGAEEMNGLGVRMEMAYSQPDREAAMIAAAFYEDADLLTAHMQLKDNALYLGSPELMKQEYLMLDTGNFGDDLAALGVYDLEDVSFNLFTLMEEVQQNSQLTKEQKKLLEDGAANFAKALQVEKIGKEEVKVNGRRISAKVYEVVIPQEAMEDYLDVLEDVIKDMDLDKGLDALEDTGLTDAADIYVSYDEDGVLETLDAMKELADEVGDLVAEIAIHKGYIVAVNSEFEAWDTEYTLDVQLGGGENYVDNLYFEMKDEDEYGILLSSEGNHAMTKGVFTDETVLTELFAGEKSGSVSCEISWEPKAREDNFEMTLKADGEKFGLEGTLICTKDSVEFTVPELEVEGVTFGFGYTLGDYKAPAITVETTHAVADMDEDDLTELAEQIVENAEDWVSDLEDEYSDLIAYVADMLYYMF